MASHGKRRGHMRRQGVPQFSEPQLKALGSRVKLSAPGQIVKTRVILPADVAITSAAWVSLTGLSFPVTAGVTTHFEAEILYTPSNVSAGSAWAITGPASPTHVTYHANSISLAGSISSQGAAGAYDGTAPSDGADAAGQMHLAVLYGLIVPSVSGTVTLRGYGETSYTTTAKANFSYVDHWDG